MNTQTITKTGTAPSFATPAASDTAEVGRVLVVKNGSAAAVTVTMETPGVLETGEQYPDKVYTVAAGGEAWIPVLQVFGSGRFANVAFSAVTSVSAAVVGLP
jgi:hypothetical protein